MEQDVIYAEIKSQLQQQSEFSGQVLQNAKAFLEISKRYQANVSSTVASNDGPKGLISSENQVLLERLTKRIQTNPALMICGPNSSGKSSFINCLFGVRLSPTGSGHVSRRICRFVYKPIEQACIQFSTLNVANKSLMPLVPPPPTIKLSNTPLKEVGDIIRPLLSDLPEDEKEWSAYCSVVVEVLYPLPLLAIGLDIYDVPGTSESDLKEVQDTLPIFWDIVRPIPIFVYSNPSLGDAELASLRKLRASMNIDLDQTPTIFFVSTHFDTDVVRMDYHVDEDLDEIPPEIIQTEINLRYGLLQRLQFFTQTPEKLEDCNFFSCVGLIDYMLPDRRRPVESVKLFTDLVRKVLLFAIRCQKKRLAAIMSIVLNGTKSFLDDVKTFRLQDVTNAVIVATEALKALDELCKSIAGLTSTCFDDFTEKLREHLNNKELKKEARKFATGIKLEAYDDKSRLSHRAEAAGAFKEKFAPWVQDRVLRPVLENLLQKLQKDISRQFVDFINANQKNEMLRDALSLHQLPIGDNKNKSDKSGEETAIVASSLLSNFTSDFSKDAMFSGIFSIVTGLSAAKAAYNLVKDANQQIDATFKQTQADNMLDELALRATPPEHFKAVVLKNSIGVADKITNEIKRRRDRVHWALGLASAVQGSLSSFRQEFGLVQATMLALNSKMMNPVGPVLDAQVATDAQRGTVTYKAKWQELDVFVKTHGSDLGSKNTFMLLEEINYLWLLTSPTLRNQPFFPLYRAVYNENSRWQLVTSSGTQSLLEYIRKRRERYNMHSALMFAIGILTIINQLHELGYNHGSLALEQFVVVEDSQGALPMLTNLGAVIAEDNFSSASALKASFSNDVQSFGKLFYELLPWPVNIRLTTFNPSTDTLPSSPRPEEKEVMDLIKECVQAQQTLRPKIPDLYMRTVALNQSLDSNTPASPVLPNRCLLCQNPDRKQLPLSCGHLALCKSCLAIVRVDSCPVCSGPGST